MATSPSQQDTRNGLKSGKLSTTSLVFIIIAASAPLTVLAGGAPTNYAVAGLLGVPIGYVVLGIILALFAVGYGRMASQIQDRKSTRLNSSHVAISYAVFCLKKKMMDIMRSIILIIVSFILH